MHERDITDTLAALGLGRLEFRTLQLLPLVQVAWANGYIGGAERDVLEDEARDLGRWDDSWPTLNRWLNHRPEPGPALAGIRLLVELSAWYDGVDRTMDLARLDHVLEAMDRVAEMNSGFLGLAMPNRERRAEAQRLRVLIEAGIPAECVGWDTLQRELATQQGAASG